jgi:hypothetical protein
MDKLSAI